MATKKRKADETNGDAAAAPLTDVVQPSVPTVESNALRRSGRARLRYDGEHIGVIEGVRLRVDEEDPAIRSTSSFRAQ